MPTTPTVAGLASLVDVLQQTQAIIDAAQVGAVSTNQFVYLAGFDGTNNTLVPTNGDTQNTNVAQLITQVASKWRVNGVRHDYF